MAEIAIPIIALGGFYILSNQEKKKEKTEAYQNMQKNTVSQQETLANYPVASVSSKKATFDNTNINSYSNPNQKTDDYFLKPINHSAISAQKNQGGVGNNNNPNVYSLTGKTINKKDFTHNNQVPFFGSKIRGSTVDYNSAERVLDNKQGMGSQSFSKEEQAPLFKPQDSIHYSHGAPNHTDFMQSRMTANVGMKMSNVTPWEQIHVGPGINQGYNTSGSNGFNSGMESRESWMPKTVDQLRTTTNPKLTFGLEGHQGPAMAPVVNPGIEGKIEKHLPDTDYAVGPDRWFTTTGEEKGQTIRSQVLMSDLRSACTSTQYFGSAVDVESGEAAYVKGEYEDSKRIQLDPYQITNAVALGQNSAGINDHNVKSYNLLPNNRVTTQDMTEMGPVYGLAKAVMAPILDILRPSRKENVVGNLRPTGNAGTTTSSSYVYNPNDTTSVTNRQMTEGKLSMQHLNVQAQDGNAYLVAGVQAPEVNRETTSCFHLGGTGGDANSMGVATYNAAYNQRNNLLKTNINRPNQGGTQMFNQSMNVCIDKNECDRENNRMWVSNGGPNVIRSSENYGELQGMQTYNQNIQSDRMNPDILTAFKNNPYTQSLQSVA